MERTNCKLYMYVMLYQGHNHERETSVFLRALLLEATGKEWYSLGLSNLTASDATALCHWDDGKVVQNIQQS